MKVIFPESVLDMGTGHKTTFKTGDYVAVNVSHNMYVYIPK